MNTKGYMEGATQEFLKFYDAYADALFRHCYFRVYERERAKELVQDTFMKTWEYLAKGNEVKNLKAFLYRVANNLVIDESRRQKPVSLDALQDEGFDLAVHDADQVQAKAEAGRISELLGKLDEHHRKVVVLRYIDGFGPKEIAHILGESENVVSVRLHRAIKQISTLYEVS